MFRTVDPIVCVLLCAHACLNIQLLTFSNLQITTSIFPPWNMMSPPFPVHWRHSSNCCPVPSSQTTAHRPCCLFLVHRHTVHCNVWCVCMYVCLVVSVYICGMCVSVHMFVVPSFLSSFPSSPSILPLYLCLIRFWRQWWAWRNTCAGVTSDA